MPPLEEAAEIQAVVVSIRQIIQKPLVAP
jgi:hypothetical protein